MATGVKWKARLEAGLQEVEFTLVLWGAQFHKWRFRRDLRADARVTVRCGYGERSHPQALPCQMAYVCSGTRAE